MKRFSYFMFISLCVALVLSSCNDDKTYAELLKDEKIVIADYIKRNEIKVLTSFPTDGVWGDSIYVVTKSGLYFHLLEPGDTTSAELKLKNTVVTRFKEYTLDVDPDTISNWSTVDFPHPTKFVYGDYSQVCEAFHEAVQYMKYTDSEAKIIVPSKIGFNDKMMSVTPLGYHLKIKIQN